MKNIFLLLLLQGEEGTGIQDNGALFGIKKAGTAQVDHWLLRLENVAVKEKTATIRISG